MANNNNDKNQKQGSMSVQEAGHRGGEATADEMKGTGFYSEIGSKGGSAPHEKRGNHGRGDKNDQQNQNNK